MVPFPPSHMRAADFRQYHAESAFPPKPIDVFASPPPPFHSNAQGGRWDSSQSYCYHNRPDGFYNPEVGPQYSNYFSGAAPMCPAEAHSHDIPREECNPQPVSTSAVPPVYQNFVHPEIKLKNPNALNYGIGYGTRCPFAPAWQHMGNYELISESMLQVPSPIREEVQNQHQRMQEQEQQHQQTCNLISGEQDNHSAYLPQQYSGSFINQMVEDEPKGDQMSEPGSSSPNVKELERRRKNNEASRKSRAQKKDRFQMELREVEYLKSENERLRKFISELDLVIQEANDTLIAKFKYQMPSNQPNQPNQPNQH